MQSIAFPNILNQVNVNVFQDHEATKSNLKLILQTEIQSLYGDPGYGCGLKKFIFEHNNAIARDLIIDKIYNTIRTFIPQLSCERKDINLKRDITNVYVDLTAKNLIDYTIDNYTIALMDFQ